MSDVVNPSILRQRAYWWSAYLNTDSGKPRYDDPPVEIKCRWERGGEVAVDTSGRMETNDKAVVYVDREIKEVDILWEAEPITDDCGCPITVDSPDDCCPDSDCEPLVAGPAENPFSNKGNAWTVKHYFRTPNSTANKFLRKVTL